MRFGCEFYTLQDPKWADAYLDYNALKQILKQSRFEGDRHSTFQRTLAQQTARISSFLQKQESLLHCWSTAVFSRFSIPIASSLLRARVFASAPVPELRDLESCLLDILGFVGRLDAFVRLNQYAIDKILAKPEAPVLEVTELSTQPWAQIVRLLKDVLHQVRLAPDSEEGTRGSTSLILSSVDPTALGCSVDKIHESIAADDSAALMVVMESPVPYFENQDMLYSVLQVAIVHKARKCTQSLLDEITVPLGNDNCGHQDPLHQLIIQVCRAEPDCSVSPDSIAEQHLLGDTFRQLTPYQHHLLFAKDWRGRTPLHYAARYGLTEVCSQAMKFMGAPAMLQEDTFGETPLYLAASSNHGAVLDLFLGADSQRPIGTPSVVAEQYAGFLLGLAVLTSIGPPGSTACTTGIQSNHIQTLAGLCKGASIRNNSGWTPLHIAAQYGRVEIAEAMLASSMEVAIDHADNAYGWTPLIAASANGHHNVARVLLLAGADAASLDRRGWSAIEHAAYRAHMPVVALLESALPRSVRSEGGKTSFAVPMSCSQTAGPSPSTVLVEDAPPIQRDSSCTSIFVNIGSFDVDDRAQAVTLETSLDLQAKSAPLNNDMLLEVSAPGCPEKPRSLRVPYVGDASTETWRFSTQDVGRARLAFKLFRGTREPGDSLQLVGAGVSLLSSLTGWFAAEQQSLRRDTRVALTDTAGDFVGSVSFTFIVCSPYTPKHTPGPPQRMKSQPTVQVVGHRGLGLNEHEVRRLQMGEHTVPSLLGAVAHGADLVEFDVQVTRDGVPVIYHDWAVSETGLDAPLHDMTHRQWMAISEAQAATPTTTPRGRLPWDERDRPGEAATTRRTSRSLCGRPRGGDEGASALLARMRHTVDYEIRRGCKGNTRGGAFIHGPFATLAEVLDALPPGVGCDVELKYPMLADAAAWALAPYAAEMNRYVDAILDVVFERAAADAAMGRPRRPLFFTCFHPDVCVLVAAKQRTYPVLFLSDSLVSGPAGDRRAASLQQALRFARQWHLPGVVLAAEPLVAAPRLIRRVKDRGLFCGTYGALNDVPELARLQAAAGLDALIVNNIRLITNALKTPVETEAEETTTKTEAETTA